MDTNKVFGVKNAILVLKEAFDISGLRHGHMRFLL